MKKRIKIITEHPLIAGSAVIFFGSFFGNIFNFIFNFVMTRYLLSSSEYGILASLTSLFTLSSQPVGAVVPTLVYFSASYFAKKDFDRVRGLFLKVTKPSLFIGMIVFIAYILSAKQIASFLNIPNHSFILIIAFMVFMGFIGIANQPLLQAKLAFRFIAFSSTLGSFLRLAFGVLFVLLGFSVGGVVWAVFIGGLVPYLLSFIPLSFLLQRGINMPHVSFKSLFNYGIPATLATFGLTLFINTDILLVKHFFAPEPAGLYATLSLIGKVIFFFSAPITMVMFPLVVQKHTKHENYHGVFRLSLLLVFISSIAIVAFYFLFPAFVISIFSKNQSAILLAPYLGLFGIFITIYSLLMVLNNFYLSINKTKVFLPILITAGLQALLIWFYHKTFLDIILISLSMVSLLLVILLLYYWKLTAGEKSAMLDVYDTKTKKHK